MEITPSQLSQEWRAGHFRVAYYLCGEEDAARKTALTFLKKTADAFNYREFSKTESGAKTAEIISELLSLPVFSERRIIVVELPDAAATLKKGLADYLKNPSSSSVLIVHSEEIKPDYKETLPKLISELGTLCIFSKLKESEAIEKLKSAAQKNGKTLSQEAAEILVREVGTNWGLLAQEMEKLSFFSSNPKIEADEAAQSLGYRKASDPFALGRLVEKRLKKETLTHLHSFFDDGKPQEQAFGAIAQMSSVILKQLKAKKMIGAGLRSDEIEKRLRLHPYWDKGFLGSLSNLSELRLRAELKRCLETEVRLKSQTWIDPVIEIEELALKICDR